MKTFPPDFVEFKNPVPPFRRRGGGGGAAMKMETICSLTGRNSVHISDILNCFSANINRI